ncbi:MAG: transposase, partial [Vicinamibacterales bacterium]
MEETRRKFDPEFKEGAVRMSAEVARELGINAGTLGNWVTQDRQARQDGEAPLSESERKELHRLRRENARLVMERDVL